MIPRKKGTCDGKRGKYDHCGAEDVFLACVSRGQCYSCSEKWKRLQRGSRQYKYKLASKKKTGELDMFIEIWNERLHFCEIHMSIGQHVPLKFFHINFFMHVLAKGAFPHKSMRLNKRNIVLGCLDCAEQQNGGSIENDPKFDAWRVLHDELEREYYLERKRPVLK